ncbi:hypothetical protein (nucleomorph) [Guillardia theta]|uniref:Uncharacterized protein n=1 Tax=Guillardia theta TaxID=55529 RepID=Q98RS3_GUITH|nr:hypothetical protein GTHECHR1082 [Guillardia theta]AAK39874.1 hypothetical protein [Guillardia theta]
MIIRHDENSDKIKKIHLNFFKNNYQRFYLKNKNSTFKLKIEILLRAFFLFNYLKLCFFLKFEKLGMSFRFIKFKLHSKIFKKIFIYKLFFNKFCSTEKYLFIKHNLNSKFRFQIFYYKNLKSVNKLLTRLNVKKKNKCCSVFISSESIIIKILREIMNKLDIILKYINDLKFTNYIEFKIGKFLILWYRKYIFNFYIINSFLDNRVSNLEIFTFNFLSFKFARTEIQNNLIFKKKNYNLIKNKQKLSMKYFSESLNKKKSNYLNIKTNFMSCLVILNLLKSNQKSFFLKIQSIYYSILKQKNCYFKKNLMNIN